MSSYWLEQKIMTSTSTRPTHDFVILGGGIAGLSVAYWLQKRDPRLKIAILEKSHLGSGASGRNAGFVTCGSAEHFMKLQEKFGLAKALEIWKFSEKNRELLQEHIIEDAAADLDFLQTGSCTVAPSAERWQQYQDTVRTMKSSGIDAHEISPADLQKDFGVTGFEGGLLYAGDGSIHPVKLLLRLYSKLQNVSVYEDTEVLSLTQNGDSQDLVTNKGRLSAPQIILALNAYLPLLIKDFQKIITPGRGQILLTKPLPPFIKGPCYLTKDLCYFRQLPTGELLIGGFRNLAAEAENTHSQDTTPLIQKALWNFVQTHFKFGAQAEISHQWAGTMAFSPDGQMLLGHLPQQPAIHLMTGCSGHGMGLSFVAARTLVESLYGQKIPDHLNVQRFFNSSMGLS